MLSNRPIENIKSRYRSLVLNGQVDNRNEISTITRVTFPYTVWISLLDSSVLCHFFLKLSKYLNVRHGFFFRGFLFYLLWR